MSTLCAVRDFGGERFCRRLAWKDDEGDNCYFHSANDKDPAEFLRRFLAEFENLGPKEDVDCKKFIFPDFALPIGHEFRNPVDLRGTQFKGVAGFPSTQFRGSANFSEAQFHKSITFERCAFFEEATFSGTRALADADYTEATFHKTAYFGGFQCAGSLKLVDSNIRGNFTLYSAKLGDANFACDFGMDAHFIESRFGGETTFELAKFGGDAEFESCTFSGIATFLDARFAGRTWFKFNHFISDVFFDRATFENTAHFLMCQASERMTFTSADFRRDAIFEDLHSGKTDQPLDLDFRSVRLNSREPAQFQGVAAPHDSRGRLNLSRTRFAFTDVSVIEFMNVKWGRGSNIVESLYPSWKRWAEAVLLAHPRQDLVRLEDEYHMRTSLENEGEDPPTQERYLDQAGHRLSIAHVAALYKGLRRAHERSMLYAEAGLFHVREMELRRQEEGYRLSSRVRPPLVGRIAGWVGRNFSLLGIYRVLSFYGESYRLAFAWVIGTIIAFAFARIAWSEYSYWHALSTSVLATFQLESVTVLDKWQRVVAPIPLALFALSLRRAFRR